MQIELYSKLNEPLDAIDRIGQWFSSSGMFGCTKAEQGKVLALVCMTEQMTPVQVLEKYYVMGDGKLSKKAHGLLAAFLKMGGKHTWLKDGSDGVSARLKLEIDGRAPVECEYSIKDAEREGLIRKGSAWEKRPRIMMRARCETEGIAMICPEIAVDDYADTETPAASPLPVQPSATVKAEPAATVRQTKADKEKERAQSIEKLKAIDAEVISAPATPADPAPTNAHPTGQESAPGPIPPLGFKVTLKDGRISPESAAALIAMVKQRGCDEKALQWLKVRDYITNGDIYTITPERLQMIFDKRDDWFSVVEAAQ